MNVRQLFCSSAVTVSDVWCDPGPLPVSELEVKSGDQFRVGAIPISEAIAARHRRLLGIIRRGFASTLEIEEAGRFISWKFWRRPKPRPIPDLR